VSIQKRGEKYVVRWREGRREPSRTFSRYRDAVAFELDIKRRRQLGPLAAGVLRSRTTLAQFMSEEWWPRYAVPNLKPSTRRRYLEVWSAHLLPRLGDYELRTITPAHVEDLIAQFRASGVGVQTQRKSIMLLQGILRRALVRGLIPANPVAVVAKPKAPAIELAQPLAPVTVEAIRVQLGRFDATLVELLAYAGLRPGEAISAKWADLGERTIRVIASKTSKARAVKLLDPLAQDLAEWRMACGRPEANQLIFPRTSDGLTAHRRSVQHAEWTRHDWHNWSGRIYKSAATNAGVTGNLRAYRLRCSFVSLLLWEGRSLTYVADQAGHSIATLAKHYSGVIQELEDQPRVPAGEAVKQA